MKQTLICTFLLMGASAWAQSPAPQSQPTPEELKRQAVERLTKGYEALPYRLVNEPGRALGLEWKDGSRLAEMEMAISKVEKTIAIEVVGNTCGEKLTGHVCDFDFRFTSPNIRLVWKKHSETARVGQVVKTDTYPLDSLAQGPDMITFMGRTNAALIESAGKEIMPMRCKNWRWLPPVKNGRLEIASWSYDENDSDSNTLAPPNTTQTTREFYDITALIGSNGRFQIERPQNPFEHIGYDANQVTSEDFASDTLLNPGQNTVWQVRQANGELCKIRLKVNADTNGLLAELMAAPRLFQPATPEKIREHSRRYLPHLANPAQSYLTFFETLEFSRPKYREWLPKDIGLDLHLLSELSWLRDGNSLTACNTYNLESCTPQAENLQ